MGLLSKLFGKKNVQKPETVKIELFGKTYDLGVTGEQLKEAEEYMDKNNINLSALSSKIEERIMGFYAILDYSENHKFCVGRTDGKVSLIDLGEEQKIYEIKIPRPHRCKVSNNGIVVCEEWGKHGTSMTYIEVFDIKGNSIIKKAIRKGGITEEFSINPEGTYVEYRLNWTGKKIRLAIN